MAHPARLSAPEIHSRGAIFAERFSMKKPFSSRFNMNRLTRISLIAIGIAALPITALPQSIWRDDSRPMYADKRGVGVGDIITIVIQESTVTSKDNKTATSRQSSVDASISSFLYSP